MGKDSFVHLANVMFLAAYLVRDILKLRILTFAAGLCLLAFHVALEPIAWPFVVWDLLFSGIQIVQIKRLIDERRPCVLSEDERAAHRLAFRSLLPRELKRLVAPARVTDAEPGHALATRGQVPHELVLILEGEVIVKGADGAALATLGPGQFVGEMSFLTGAAAAASAEVGRAARLLCFPKDALRALLDAQPELKSAVQATLGHDLVAKLRR